MNQQDHRIQVEVMQELGWDPGLDATQIGVRVREGAVTLSGPVSTYSAKRRAIDVAERIRGVRVVADDLEVRVPDRSPSDDARLAESIAHMLRWNVDIPEGVSAEVAAGEVTLRGDVESLYQQRAAEQAVRHLVGVRNVANQMRVTRPAPASDIKLLIHDAIERSAELDARDIRVTVTDGTAHLVGKVHSIHEAKAAREAAAAAPGIRHVDSRIVVVD